MKVSLEQLSVPSDSYLSGGRGNPRGRSLGDKGSSWVSRANLRAATWVTGLDQQGFIGLEGVQ